MEKIGLGGSCHWCTEAIFQSLLGVKQVLQGWISASGDHADFSEGVLVEYDESVISLDSLVEIHLHTHSCTARHAMRAKYRSAVYVIDEVQAEYARCVLERLQADFSKPIITLVLAFQAFKLNKEEYLNYYYAAPDKPFCENIVSPKLKLLLDRFSGQVDRDKLRL